jgi:hypothetical protein
MPVSAAAVGSGDPVEGVAGAMIKAIGTRNGRELLMIGLSFGNLDKFRAEPGDTFIQIDGRELGISLDVMIFSGETEAHMAELMKGTIGPQTLVHVDPRLKS